MRTIPFLQDDIGASGNRRNVGFQLAYIGFAVCFQFFVLLPFKRAVVDRERTGIAMGGLDEVQKANAQKHDERNDDRKSPEQNVIMI